MNNIETGVSKAPYGPDFSVNNVPVWNGSAWVAQKVAEAQLNLTDVTTANVSSTAHGLAPKSPADATQFLNGAATPAFAQVKDSDLSTSDVTTNNVSTTKHGFAPKSPNDAAKYLDGTAAYSVPNADGWLSAEETWTYASATTFTVSGVDVTAKYSKGTRLRFKQGAGYLYFVVVSSSFSTNTTVTITGGSDYTLANAAITNNYYSYSANPQGYPAWFNFTTSWVGFSSNPTTSTCRFHVIGNLCNVQFQLSAYGTSNGTTLTFTVPINALGGSGGFCQGRDNGVNGTNLAFLTIAAASNVVSAFKDAAATAWTASGSKAVDWVNFNYAI